jgi:hypothetical protein
MKTRLILLLATLLLSGCAGFWANREPGASPAPEKITSDINMNRAYPKSAESRP